MDSRHRRRPSSDRFLTVYSPSFASNSDAASISDELNEDDIFFSGTVTEDFSNPLSTSSTPHPTLLNNQNNHLSKKTFNPEAFGILAVLPESSGTDRSVFNHKPQPPMTIPLSRRNSGTLPELMMSNSSPIMGTKYHQSAPLKVPMMHMRERRCLRQRGSAFGYEDILDADDGDEDEGEMLPPHEIVARKMAKFPVLSCSVLEGAGRTLKGRDLRQVRNAVFRQTGFVD